MRLRIASDGKELVISSDDNCTYTLTSSESLALGSEDSNVYSIKSSFFEVEAEGSLERNESSELQMTLKDTDSIMVHLNDSACVIDETNYSKGEVRRGVISITGNSITLLGIANYVKFFCTELSIRPNADYCIAESISVERLEIPEDFIGIFTLGDSEHVELHVDEEDEPCGIDLVDYADGLFNQVLVMSLGGELMVVPVTVERNELTNSNKSLMSLFGVRHNYVLSIVRFMTANEVEGVVKEVDGRPHMIFDNLAIDMITEAMVLYKLLICKVGIEE